MKELNILLRKLIKTGAERVRFVMAIIGLSIAMILILSAVQLQSNYNELLQGSGNRDSIANFLVVNKILTDQNLKNTTLSDAEINDIRAQRFTDAVGILQSSRFKASIQSSSAQFPFYTDIAFESVPDSFLDVSTKEWNWEPSSGFVPIIVPGMFLDIYNFQFSLSQGLPQLTRELVKMIFFRVNLYDNKGMAHSMRGRVVGFSNRISSLLVPQSFMDWANRQYGGSLNQAPSRIIIRTKDHGDPGLVSYLKEKKLSTDQDKTRFSRYRQVVDMVVNISGTTGLLMLLFALLIFTLFIQLTISSCKEEIKLLLTLGTSPKQLSRFLMGQFFPSNIIITTLSVAILCILQYIVYSVLLSQQVYILPYISVSTVLTAVIILCFIWLVNFINIRKYIEKN
ncbi:MAG: FtsX-like permease family protein [Bacteroidota bacterium]